MVKKYMYCMSMGISFHKLWSLYHFVPFELFCTCHVYGGHAFQLRLGHILLSAADVDSKISSRAIFIRCSDQSSLCFFTDLICLLLL